MEEDTPTPSEVAEAVDHPDEPTSKVAEWTAVTHLSRIEGYLGMLTTGPWAVHPDPESPGTYYLSGPPETRVVAEGLTLEDANAILGVINELPETLEYFTDLARLWDVFNDGILDSQSDELRTYLEVISKYQMHIAQLEGNPAPIPEVSSAADLSFMHVGHLLTVEGTEYDALPIVAVSRAGELVSIRAGAVNEVHLILSPDHPVQVTVFGQMAKLLPSSTDADEEQAEELVPAESG